MNAAVKAAVEEEALAARAQMQARASRQRALERIRFVREKEREAAEMEKLGSHVRPRKNQTEFVRDEAERKMAAAVEKDRRDSEGDRLIAMAEAMEREVQKEQERAEEAAREEVRQAEAAAALAEQHQLNNRRRIAAAEAHRQRIAVGAKLSEQRSSCIESSRTPLTGTPPLS